MSAIAQGKVASRKKTKYVNYADCFEKNSRLFLLQKIKRRKEKCNLKMIGTKADL